MNNGKNDIFYDLEYAEVCRYTCVHEAIEMILDAYHPDPIPRKITLCTYSREKIVGSLNIDVLLENLIEQLDERYGSPDGEFYTPCKKMKSVALNFINKIQELYIPWTCEIISKKEIDTVEWVKENAPNWIEEGVKFKTISSEN